MNESRSKATAKRGKLHISRDQLFAWKHKNLLDEGTFKADSHRLCLIQMAATDSCIAENYISLCRNATVCCTHMHQKQYVQISLYLVYQILLSMHKVKNNYIGPYLVRQFLEAAFMNLDRLFQLKCLLNEGNFQIVTFSRISNIGKIKR